MTPKFVEFDTPDGLCLPGLLYETEKTDKAVIYLHGNGSSSIFYDEKEHRLMPEAINKKGVSFFKFNNRGANVIKKLNVKMSETETERKPFGMAFEKIRECVPDIDGAVNFLKGLGYREFYLAGASTGANKICVYDHYKKENIFSKYILICGGDDTGIYYSMLGDKKFFELLKLAKKNIEDGLGENLISDPALDEVFSYQGFYDIANPDGDYNVFPYSEAFGNVKISTTPLFAYFKSITKPSLVLYGEKDDYAWGQINKVVETLKNYQPKFDYKIIKDADHQFTGKREELAETVARWL